ncbi:MAG: rhomboid family intramembrane serine protease [Bacteroidales bacterium]|nr:rhomboid family intramembrane serine protease [Bacteroidales bacterium]
MNQYRLGGFRVLPTIVKNLIIINIIFYIATLAFRSAFGIDLTDYLGLYFFKSENFHFYQYVTYMFMHGDFQHIFFNMFALWMFGNVLENYWGPKRFLTFYFVTGIGAAIVHTIVIGIDYFGIQAAINAYAENPNPEAFVNLVQSELSSVLTSEKVAMANSLLNEWQMNFASNSEYAIQSVDMAQSFLASRANIATVGASGAVYGILLAFGMMFPNEYIYLYFFLPMKAKWFVLGYGLIELVSGVLSTGDGIAHFAHLGGMIFGFFLIKYWKKQDINKWQM